MSTNPADDGIMRRDQVEKIVADILYEVSLELERRYWTIDIKSALPGDSLLAAANGIAKVVRRAAVERYQSAASAPRLPVDGDNE